MTFIRTNIKVIWIFLCILLSLHSLHTQTLPNLYSIEERTCTILRRLYIIERLRSKITLLTKLYKQWPLTHSGPRKGTPSALPPFEFSNPCIADSWVKIQETHSLKPLLDVWDRFTAYHYLDDPGFTEGLGQELFILTKLILQDLTPSLFDKKPLSAEFFENLNRNEIIDQITQRFYIINRLQRASKLLVRLKKNKKFSNQKGALFELAKNVNHINEYKNIDDENLINTCCITLIAAFAGMSKSLNPQFSWNKTGEGVSTEELLNNLDEVTGQLENLMIQPKNIYYSYWCMALGVALGCCAGMLYAIQ